MSIQAIIDRCDGISINRRKMVGIQYSLNQIPRISETPTTNPWRFSISMPNSLRYSEARSIIEQIDNLDRRSPETITFGNNPAMSWIFRYQGAASLSNLDNITVTSFVGNSLVLTNLPVLGANALLFAANDVIQIDGYPYPFTSVYDVPRGITTSVTVTTHRPNILSNPVAGANITVGSNVQFRVFCNNMPTYRLTPGGATYSNGVLVNNAYIEWSDMFNLYEYVGLA